MININHRTAQALVAQRCGQRHFVHHRPACDVNQPRAGFHQADSRSTHEIARPLSQRAAQRNEITLATQRINICASHKCG